LSKKQRKAALNNKDNIGLFLKGKARFALPNTNARRGVATKTKPQENNSKDLCSRMLEPL
jgi:hypothetical protein